MTSFAQAMAGQSTLVWLPVAVVDSIVVTSSQMVTLNRDGTVTLTQNGVTTSLGSGAWIANRSATIGDLYEARLDDLGPDTWTAVVNTWQTLGFNRNYVNSGAPSHCTGNLHIRRIGSTQILRSCFIDFNNL